jgi:hypothetical protein
LCVEAGATAADRVRREPGEGGEQRRGDGRVADPDLAEHDHVAALGEVGCQRVTGLDSRAQQLGAESGTGGDVATSVGEAAVDDRRRLRAAQTDVGDDQIAVSPRAAAAATWAPTWAG